MVKYGLLRLNPDSVFNQITLLLWTSTLVLGIFFSLTGFFQKFVSAPMPVLFSCRNFCFRATILLAFVLFNRLVFLIRSSSSWTLSISLFALSKSECNSLTAKLEIKLASGQSRDSSDCPSTSLKQFLETSIYKTNHIKKIRKMFFFLDFWSQISCLK